MEENHRNKLRESLPFLLENLKVIQPLDQIYSSKDKILTDEDYAKIRAETTEQDKIRHTISILLRSGPKAFHAFIHSLKSTDQAYIAEELLKENGSEQSSDLEDSENQLPVLGKELYGAAGCSWKQQQNKRDSTLQASTLTGYIHQLQKKSRSKRGKWFSSFLVQTGETTYQRCITFFPDFHKDALERYAKDQISVCLKRCSYMKGKYKKNTVTIDTYTEFETTEVRFPYTRPPYTPLADIDKYCRGEFFLIKVKIIKEHELTNKVKKYGMALDMQVKLVCDKDGVEMELTAWQQFVSLLSIGKWYELNDVSVKVFDGSCKLSTNTSTSAKEVSF